MALIVFAVAAMVTGPGWVFAGAAVAFVGLCVRVAQKVGRRRCAALDDLVLRAPGLAPAERQRELDRIVSDYGSGVGPAVRKAKAAIHTIPFDHAD